MNTKPWRLPIGMAAACLALSACSSSGGSGPKTVTADKAPPTGQNAAGQIYFTSDSHEVTSTARALIAKLAERAKTTAQGKKIRIEGHASQEGTAEHNMELSEMRARAVADTMLEFGVDGSRMEIVGFGETQPKLPVGTPNATSINRRVEIIFY